ncbi:MAG: helix-turn-helix domain-containing protein, partial [Anaerolineae bacterium]|nr:helix-turn-helix domain-containing protein [Anaerolineae bacterium]
GKTQNTISGYENGTRTPRTEEMPQVAAALDRPIAYFFGDDFADEEIMGYVHQLTSPFRAGLIIQLRQMVVLQTDLMSLLQRDKPDADLNEINEQAKRFVEDNAQDMGSEIQANFEKEMRDRVFRKNKQD